MKLKSIILIGSVIIPFVTSCVNKPLALAPIGPNSTVRSSGGIEGYLQVFSATQKSAPVVSDDSWLLDLHTGYDIYGQSGKESRFVPNHMSNLDTSADTVTLLAGTYNIVAESTWYGLVTVPVFIQEGKTTAVHLDNNWFPSSNTSAGKLVFLSNGEAAGWSSETNEEKTMQIK